ncbi:hypothetical protein D3C75_965630 [compost metagenome]
MSAPLQRFDNPQFMFWGYTCIDIDIIRDLIQRIVVHPGQLAAGQHSSAALQNAQLMGNGFRCRTVVTGNHHRFDACPAGYADRIAHLTPRRIDHPGQSDKDQLAFRFLLTARHFT